MCKTTDFKWACRVVFTTISSDERNLFIYLSPSRWILPLLVFSSVSPAPQDNSDITYVKIQPLPGDPLLLNHSSRGSRIQILPLSIGGNTQHNPPTNKANEAIINDNNQFLNPTDEIATNADVRIVSDVFKRQTINITAEPESVQTYNHSANNTDVKAPKSLLDQSIDAAIINKFNRIASGGPIKVTSNLSESNHDKRFARNEDFSTVAYDTENTDVSERESELATVAYEARTKAPRFISKLSYFHKTTDLSGSNNLVESGNKKRFRSRCRCEKIWNCPKLQITVPRCPNEYFLCCF
ncbi:uncharacterized protein LOC131848897 [Achroia grisella]|uniref:uncharacterized protein LOC131848897 n=1 Tax=Achroia grisella TaxID=688607 RepID=UPI0027D2653A|nr:uncharacterized protein LOC131848897 [Achroia grisella]